jgi:hypothetical protein
MQGYLKIASFLESAFTNLISRVGLGAEDLNDLLAQRRLDPTERKMKYKMEANTKWKEQREKEALALAKRLDDDVYDLESKSVQLSKKRQRGMSKSAFIEQITAPKKKSKAKEIETEIADVKHELAAVESRKVEDEVVFDFSSSAVVEQPQEETKETKIKDKLSKGHRSSSESSKHTHKKNHDKHKVKHSNKHKSKK